MRQPFVAGNWKMNGSRESAGRLLEDLVRNLSPGNREVAVCPPFVYLADAMRVLKGSEIALGAQNVSEEESGAFTGEVSATMLQDFDCAYVIVGHSERRALYGETDEVVARKFMAAVRTGLRPILCVGETLEQREEGITDKIIGEQLDAILGVAGVHAFKEAVVAYEPVWAIGTGQTASPDQAQAVHAMIRSRVAAADDTIAAGLRIVYGGSVKATNASELFAMEDIDGGLIGGASLDAESFLSICQSAESAGHQ
ncbi:triose-phosphate isomerase [Natronospira bacteriovora]|uniref:Triosephosphate isomerase n=1 Tax=Natronospira bacteriovora TaxID=3069753 RepID=A0ABU0W534_9GAMM|nr:triose-phosphate isomerase [Natronospira sp. AB-CW4]MDQ2069127.1 triose-phosphate isomerase [Natronospira sp. AB-CW4]